MRVLECTEGAQWLGWSGVGGAGENGDWGQRGDSQRHCLRVWNPHARGHRHGWPPLPLHRSSRHARRAADAPGAQLSITRAFHSNRRALVRHQRGGPGFAHLLGAFSLALPQNCPYLVPAALGPMWAFPATLPVSLLLECSTCALFLLPLLKRPLPPRGCGLR